MIRSSGSLLLSFKSSISSLVVSGFFTTTVWTMSLSMLFFFFSLLFANTYTCRSFVAVELYLPSGRSELDDPDTIEVLTALNEGRAGYDSRTSALSISLRIGLDHTISEVLNL